MGREKVLSTLKCPEVQVFVTSAVFSKFSQNETMTNSWQPTRIYFLPRVVARETDCPSGFNINQHSAAEASS